MKRIFRTVLSKVLCLSIILMLQTPSFARDYMEILRFDKGDVFNDGAGEQALSKQHGKNGKVCMKITFKEGSEEWIGELNPGKKAWGNFKYVKFHVFNDEQEERELNFTIKGAKEPPNDKSNWYEKIFKLKPGENDCEIALDSAVCVDGKSKLDYSKIYLYAFRTDKSGKPLTIFISDFKLTK